MKSAFVSVLSIKDNASFEINSIPSNTTLEW